MKRWELYDQKMTRITHEIIGIKRVFEHRVYFTFCDLFCCFMFLALNSLVLFLAATSHLFVLKTFDLNWFDLQETAMVLFEIHEKTLFRSQRVVQAF